MTLFTRLMTWVFLACCAQATAGTITISKPPNGKKISQPYIVHGSIEPIASVESVGFQIDDEPSMATRVNPNGLFSFTIDGQSPGWHVLTVYAFFENGTVSAFVPFEIEGNVNIRMVPFAIDSDAP